jgi:hypothetical protein
MRENIFLSFQIARGCVIFFIDVSQRFKELDANLQGLSHLSTKHLTRLQGMSESFDCGNRTCDIADLNLRLICTGFQTPLPLKDFTVFSLFTGICDPGRGGIIS